MKKHDRPKIIRWLLYLVLVTSVITSVSLAKYASGGEGTAQAVIAAFTSGTSLDLEVPLQDMLSPGDTKTVDFTVTNFNGEKGSEILLGYEIQIETSGNLPLEFALTGEKESGDTDVENSVLALPFDKNTLKAVGGKLPPVGMSGRKSHSYRLTIQWPQEKADEGYSDEIDHVTVKITSTQGKG